MDRVALSKWGRKLTQRSMYNKQRQVQDFYDYVITPNGFSASEGNSMVWYRKYNNHIAQRWNIDTQKWTWYAYPTQDNVKF